jgi:acetolactate decarboxylase
MVVSHYWFKLILLFSSLLFLLGNLSSCGSDYNVEFYGELKKVMKGNDLSPSVDFAKIENTKNLYALGALEDLKGEVIVINGEPFIFKAVEDSFTIKKDFDFKMVFGVSSVVRKWKEYPINPEIRTHKDLENFILLTAKNNGINVDEPFPFLIEGLVSSISWHIVNWPEDDNEHTHEKHVKSGPNGTNIFESVILLGFYSDKHHGVFTHHEHNTHMHFIKNDGKLGGHVDDFVLGDNMILKLPA